MVWQCYITNNSNIVVTVVLAYLVLLQIIAIVMAIQTRRVKIKVLNDSKYIIALIYISSITVVLLIAVKFALGSVININELLVSGAFFIATTSFLSLTFIPKVFYSNHPHLKLMQFPHSIFSTKFLSSFFEYYGQPGKEAKTLASIIYVFVTRY